MLNEGCLNLLRFILTWFYRYKNKDFAHLMQLYSKSRINRYERHFLRFLDFRLFVSTEEFKR